MLLLFFNAILYIVVTFLYIRRSGGINVHTFIWLWFSFTALMGWITYFNGTYPDLFGDPKYEVTLSAFYYIIAFFIYLYLFKPIKSISQRGLDYRFVPRSKLFFNFIIGHYLMMFLLMLVLLPHVNQAFEYGLENMYEDYRNDGESVIPVYIRPLVSYYRGAQYFLLVYSGYLLTFDRYKNIALLGLLEIVLLNFFMSFLVGSRGGVFFQVVDYCFIYLLFEDRIHSSIKRVIKYASIGGIVVIAVLMWRLSVGRTQDQDSDIALTQIERYFGEAFPNYGFRVMGLSKKALNGERFAPDIYNLVSDKKAYVPDGLADMQSYFGDKTGLPIINFKTLVGDFYAEFSLAGLFVLLLIGFVFAKMLSCPPNGLAFYKTMILLYYLQFCFGGALDNIKYMTAIKVIVMNIVWILVMRKVENMERKKQLLRIVYEK